MVVTSLPMSKQRRQRRMWNPTVVPAQKKGYDSSYLMMSFMTDAQQQQTNWIAKINKSTLQPMVMKKLSSAKKIVNDISTTNCEMAYSAALHRYFYITCPHNWQHAQSALSIGFLKKSGDGTPANTAPPTPAELSNTQQQVQEIIPLHVVALKDGTGVMPDSLEYAGNPYNTYGIHGVNFKGDLTQASAYNSLWYEAAQQGESDKVTRFIRASTDKHGDAWIIDDQAEHQQTLIRVGSGGALGTLAKKELIRYPESPPQLDNIQFVADIQTDRNGDLICLFDAGSSQQSYSIHMIKYLASKNRWLGLLQEQQQAPYGQWIDTEIEGEQQQQEYHKVSGAIDKFNNIWIGDPDSEDINNPLLYCIRNDNFELDPFGSQQQPVMYKTQWRPSDLFPTEYQGDQDTKFRISGIRGDMLGNVFAVGRFYGSVQVGGTGIQQRLFLLKLNPSGVHPAEQQNPMLNTTDVTFVDLTDILQAQSQQNIEGLDISCEDELGRKDY